MKIGALLFNKELMLEDATKEEAVAALKILGQLEHLKCYDYPDGHHPSFFERHPELIGYKND